MHAVCVPRDTPKVQLCGRSFAQPGTVVRTQAARDLRRRCRRSGLLLLVAPSFGVALGLLLTLAIECVLLFLRDPRLLSERERHRFARSLASRRLARKARDGMVRSGCASAERSRGAVTRDVRNRAATARSGP